MNEDSSRSVLDLLLRSSAACATFSSLRTLQSMLDFEAALARAEARIGLIPSDAAEAIGICCQAERFDMKELSIRAASSGNLAIPMVHQLTELVRNHAPAAAGFVHWGATSQDAIDTGSVLQLRKHFKMLEAGLWQIGEALADLVTRHGETVMVGRTWLQHAVPITFGFKVAGYLDAILRHIERLAELRPRLLVLQFGGAVGTLAALGYRGPDVAEALGQELDLPVPAIPWHAHRDRVAEAATFQGLLVGTLGKIARDLALLGQTEVAEAMEPSSLGRGGSSTMPHKHNPIVAACILATAVRVPPLVGTMLSAMVQEHERGLGGWQAEWEILPEICMLTLGALEKLEPVLAHLRVDPEAMRRNLEVTRGLILAEAVSMALAKSIGRDRAHEFVEKLARDAVRQGHSLRDTLAQAKHSDHFLSPAQIESLLDPANYTGESSAMATHVLERFRSLRETAPLAQGDVDHAKV